MGRLIPIAPTFKTETHSPVMPPNQISKVVHLSNGNGEPVTNIHGLVLVNEPAQPQKTEHFVHPADILYSVFGLNRATTADHTRRSFTIRARPAAERVVMSIHINLELAFWTYEEFEAVIETMRHDVYISTAQTTQNIQPTEGSVTLYTTDVQDYAELSKRVYTPRKQPLRFDIAAEEHEELVEWCAQNLLKMYDLDVTNGSAYLRVKDDVEEIHAKLRWCG